MNLQKSKILLNTLVLTLVFLMSSILVFKGDVFADEYSDYLKDADGQVLKTGKQYYISDVRFPKRALTFESYNNWDYVLATNEKNDDKLHGTSIRLFIANTNEKEDISITKYDDLILKMDNSNWERSRYMNFDRTGGYVWLDSEANTVSLEQDNYKDGIAINAGATITKHYDSAGRITGGLFGKYSVTDDTYLYLFPSGQVGGDINKLWASIYMRRHFHINGKEIIEMKPSYLFTAVK